MVVLGQSELITYLNNFVVYGSQMLPEPRLGGVPAPTLAAVILDTYVHRGIYSTTYILPLSLFSSYFLL